MINLLVTEASFVSQSLIDDGLRDALGTTLCFEALSNFFFFSVKYCIPDKEKFHVTK